MVVLESDEPIEQSELFEGLDCLDPSSSNTYSSLWSPTNFPNFPPSPTFFPEGDPTNFLNFPPSPPLCFPPSPRPPFPLYSPVERLVLSVDQLIQGKLGEYNNLMNGLAGDRTLTLINAIKNQRAVFDALDLEVKDMWEDYEVEERPKYIGDKQVILECRRVDYFEIEIRGGELYVIPRGALFKINGVEYSTRQAPSRTTPEPPFVFTVGVSLNHRGEYETIFKYGWYWVNLGTKSGIEEEAVVRGWKHLVDVSRYPPEHHPIGLEDEAIGLEGKQAPGNDGIGCEGTGDCAMADQDQFNSGSSKKRKTREKNPGGQRRDKKNKGVRIAIHLDDILQTKEMRLKDAANHLQVSTSKLKSSCREHGILRWPPLNTNKLTQQSLPEETPMVVNQDGFPQLASHNMLSNQATMVTVDTNSGVEKEVPPPQNLPTAQQENLDVGFGNNEGEAIEMEVEEVNPPGGERGNNRSTGVRIAIPKEDILQVKEMTIIDAANHLEVSKSTLKRVCREYGINRWPPRKEHELISQSRPNKPPVVVDQEQISQLNPNTLLPSNDQVTATTYTCSVIKVRCEEGTIKFQLSRPWRKVELEQQVKKRLSFEAGTYNINYKDEDDELILINCDADLEDCISTSSSVGSRPIELFLKLK